MLDTDKTREQLISELSDLRTRLSNFQRPGAGLDDHCLTTNEKRTRYIEEVEDLYNNAPCGYHSLDPHGVFIRINDTELKWLGYTREEMIGRINVVEILTEESFEIFNANFPILKSRGWVKDLAFDLIRKDGTHLGVLLSATAVRDSDGNYVMSRSVLVDISDRRQAELELRRHEECLELMVHERTRQLQESETNYRELWQKTPAMMISLNRHAQIDYASDRFCEELGYSREEIIGKRPFEFQTEESSRFAEQTMFPKFLQTGFIVNAPLQFDRRDGTIMDVLLNSTAETDPNGYILRSRSVFTDVTALKRAQQDLQQTVDDLQEARKEREQSQKVLRLFVDNSPVAMAMFDREMRYLDVSPRWLDDYGLTGADIIGKSHYEIFPEITDHWKEIHERSLNGEVVRGDKDKFVRTDGSMQWLRWETRPWFSAAGEIGGIIIFTEDITPRKRAEDTLRIRDDAINSAVFGIGFANPDDGTFVHCNQAFAKMWGFDSSDDVIGIPAADLFYDKLAFAEVVAELQLKGSHQGTLTCRRSDGTTFEAEGTSSVLKDEQGSPILHTVSCIDITDRKKAQRQLQISRAYLRSLFDTIPETVFLMTADGEVLSANKTFAARFGLAIRDCIGKCVYDLFPTELANTRKGFVAKAITEKNNVHWEDVRNGRTFENSIYPVLDETGQVDKLAVYAADITHSKTAEKLLAASEKRYRLFVEMADEGIWSIDHRSRITFANRKMALMLGYSIDEMLGIPANSMMFDEDIADHERRMELRRLNQSDSYERRLKKKDGSAVWTIVSATPLLDDDDNFIGSFGMFTDITDRKKAEEDIKRSEQRLRLALEAAGAGSWEWDLRTNEHYWSDELCELYGLNPLRCKPSYDSWLMAIHADDRSHAEKAIQYAISKLQDMNIEWRVNLLGGEERWLMSRGRPVFDDKNQATSYMGVVVDITDRKKSEIEIRRSNEFLDTILNNIPVMVSYMDNDGRYQYVNRSWQETLGWSMEEAKTMDILPELSPDPDLKLHFKKFVLDSMTTAPGRWDDFNMMTRDGHIIGASWVFVPTASGHYVGIGLDISDRVKATETRELLAAVVEHSAESIIITDTNGVINYVNPAFEQNTGYSSEESLGRNPGFIKSGEHDKRFYEDFWKTILAGRPWHGILINRRKDGSLLEEDSTVFPIKVEPSGSTNYVAIKRDISRESSLQRQLLQAQKLEALANLAGGIAHDFNNIIFGIMGYTELAMTEIPQGSRAYANLERVINAANRSGAMVQQILAFSRQGSTDKSGLDLRPLVKEGLKFLRAAIPTTLAIESHVEPGETRVLADPTQIHQVLMNLCINAAHAIGDNTGTISVDLSEIEVQPEFAASNPPLLPGKCMRLQVTDTGSGISPENMNRIFDPYFTTKEAGKGTGLGLSVVYGIVTDHGGVIKVSSGPSKGSTFEVFFPVLATGISIVEKVSESPSEDEGNEHILVVDDEAFLLKMYEDGLIKLGYRVTCSSDPGDALKLFQKRPEAFDIVISDYSMPGMNGVELTREMTAIRPGIPVIICSGAMKIVEGLKDEQPWIAEVIPKPLRFSKIVGAIRKVLDR